MTSISDERASLVEIEVLDGGMGTTLEDEFSSDITSSLWSSAMLQSEAGQQTLLDLHTRWIEAGANLIETCNYQSSLEGFGSNGCTREEAVALMRRAVRLVKNSINSSSTIAKQPLKAVLSLGCYGATLSPGQEYAGNYPAPFGPPSSETSLSSLAEWHYERLLIFADDEETWKAVDVIAFETVPLQVEGLAIKRAMFMLSEYIRAKGDSHMPDWYISFVFPDGRIPQDATSASDLARSMLSGGEGTQSLDLPGIGINCTKIQYLPELIQQLGKGSREARPAKAPTLILYPDGGLTYDVMTRTWSSEGTGSPEVWARTLVESVSGAEAASTWSRVVLGGCCKASPAHIAALRKAVDER